MYLNNNEAFDDINKKGLFLCRSGHGGTGRQVICHKTGKNSFKEVANPTTFFKKVKSNICISSNTPICHELDLQVFADYDKRKDEIKTNKAIVKNLKPRNFLKIEKAVLCRGYGNYYAIDVEAIEAFPIEAALIEEEELSDYRKDVIMNALRETGVNRYEKSFKKQEEIWKKISK